VLLFADNYINEMVYYTATALG